ncbi:ATP-binding cassette sub-family A member 12 [Bagarius yarrelli]|uniref:ATP-binding cassette sub-family A member 12 n=1 Tax=Bagarius yarrelli TaxID=175774 RepID=A0A556V6B8_BAGYA|nr:ATP-binding cassette sub-family A member 12 [Bagarius yarrelli]
MHTDRFSGYVAPRNLPSSGFFPFLQTLLCNTDSTCSNSSYLTESKSKSLRQRRDLHTHRSPLLPHGLPALPDLEELGLVHLIRKRDTSTTTEIQEQRDTWLSVYQADTEFMLNSSSSSNLSTSILEALNNTVLAEENVWNTILDSTSTLKTTFCNFSMSVLSNHKQVSLMLEKLCATNDTALEMSLTMLNQLLAQMVLKDPVKAIETLEMSVETMDKLQTQSSLWDFLLGLPNIFLKSTDQERITAIAEQLIGMKEALNSFQSSFQQANASVDMLNPVIDEGVELLNYLQTWKGRDVNISLANVLVTSNLSVISPEMATLQIPLDKVVVLFNRAAFFEFVCTNSSSCDSQEVKMIYDWIDREKVALQVLLAWSQAATSPEDLLFAKDILAKLFAIGDAIMDLLNGTPSWHSIQTLMMGADSTMKFATAAMETQLAYLQQVLQNPKNIQETLEYFLQNDTRETPWSDVFQKLNQISDVLNGTLAYGVTPAMILMEWNSFENTKQQYIDNIMEAAQLINKELISLNTQYSSVNWSETLINSTLERFATIGPDLQNSSYWSVMKPHFQLAYWILTFQPNKTAPLNCTFSPNDTICQMEFSWEGFISVVASLLQEIRENPAALLRPIRGAHSLLKDIITETYLNHLQEFPNSTSNLPPGVLPKNISMSLVELVNQNLQLLLNIPPTDELDEDLLLDLLNGTLEAFGLGQLGTLWSEDSSYSNSSTLYSVLMNTLHQLSPESIQMLDSEGRITVLCAILKKLLSPEQQIQLENVFNHTYALFKDLALCKANGQDCLSEVSQLLQILSSGEDGNFTIMPVQYNTTMSIAGHILSLLLPWNLTESTGHTVDNVSEIIRLLEQLSSSPSLNMSTIQEELQALNITMFDLTQSTPLSEASFMSLLLSKLVNVSQCLDPLLQDRVLYTDSRVPECIMQITEGLIDFLQATPMMEGFPLNFTSISTELFEEVLGLSNMSNLETVLPGIIELISEHSNYSNLNSVVMNILHLLRPESVQMLQNKGQFALSNAVLHELGALLANDQQINVDSFLNHTHALFNDLAVCAVRCQDCLSGVSQLFQILSLLNESTLAGEGGNFTLMLIECNMTLPIAGHILSFFLPWNISESSKYSIYNVSEIIHLFQQLSDSHNLSFNSLQEMLEALNLTMLDLEQISQQLENSSTSLLLLRLMDLVNNSQCMNTVSNTEPECSMKIIEGLIGFLQAIPMFKDFQTTLNMVYEEAMEFSNITSVESDPLEVTEEVFELILESIKMNLGNFDIENVTMIEKELDSLEGVLKVLFEEEQRYPYHTINSTLMTQQSYAQNMCKEITLWYLHKLENATSDSMFQEILDSFIQMTEMTAKIYDAQSNFSKLVSSQMQNLTDHVQPPLNSEDLNQIFNAVVSLMQGQLELIKMNLNLHQTFYEFLGFQPNVSMPAVIEAQIQNYNNLTQSWITNPQLTLVFSKMLQWNNNLTDFTTPAMDLEQLMQALAPLLSPEEQVYINKTEEVLQSLNYVLQLSRTDAGLHSKNFTEAIMDSVQVFLDRMFNYTDTTYTNADLVEVLSDTLQLLLNPNISHAQAQQLIIQLAEKTESFISAVAPDSAKVLTPTIQSLISSINTISNATEPTQWTEALENMTTALLLYLMDTPAGDTLSEELELLRNVTGDLVQSLQIQTELLLSLLAVMPSYLPSSNVTLVTDAVLQAFRSTVETTLQEVDPQWVEATVAEIASSLEVFYSAAFNESVSVQHLLQDFLKNFSVEGTDQIHSLSFAQIALENVMLHLNNSERNPYILAVYKALNFTLDNQNLTANPKVILHAVEVVLTAMNYSSEQIDSFLSSDVFTMPNSLPFDLHIKEVINKSIQMRLLGNWTIMYNILEQVLYVENKTSILRMLHELISWYNTTEDTGVSFGLNMFTKLYEMLGLLVPTLSPSPCYSDLLFRLAGNALNALQHIFSTTNLFTPINSYLKPIQMKLALGDNLRDLVSETQNARTVVQNLTREPVDDFLDLLEINYQNLSQILSIPLTSEEILETMHVFFANPDLGIYLKGVSRNVAGTSVEDETIDTILGTLAYLTLPSNGQTFIEMIKQTFSQPWGLKDIQLGRIVGLVRMLSQQSSLNIAQRVEQMANQLTSAATYTMAHEGNHSEILTAINNILSQNLQQITNTSLEDQTILQEIINSLTSKSQVDFGSYMIVINQTTEALASVIPPEELVYFNLSAQIMEAFALLMLYPTDPEKVVMSSHKIADSMGLSLALANSTALPNGQPIENNLYPFVLNSALATQILFNLSASNYTFASNFEESLILTQMTSTLQKDVQEDLSPLTSALLLAFSNVSDTSQIESAFLEITQNVTMDLLQYFNLTGDPMSIGMHSVLFTVSNEVSACLIEGSMGNSSSNLLPYIINSLQAVISSLSLALPSEDQQYPGVVFKYMETMALALNHTITTGDAEGGMKMISNSVESLLLMMPNNSTDNSSGIISDLENTIKTLLIALSSGHDPITQTSMVTNEMLAIIQNLLSAGDSSSEIDLANAILGAFKMNAGSLLVTNDSNLSQNLQMMLLSAANALPADLQFGPFNRTILESLANESKENLNILLQIVSTVSQLFSTNWMNDSFGDLLNQVQMQVCSLENMQSVRLLNQVFLSPGFLCRTALPSISALHLLTSNLVNQTSEVYDVLYQNLVGDLKTYDLNVDWTLFLSDMLGINITALPGFTSNRTTTNLSPLQLNPAAAQVFASLCSLSVQEWYNLAVLSAQHVDTEGVMYKLMLNSEIQDLIDVLMQMLKFFMDIMSKLAPALNRLQEYFTSFGNMRMMSNPEFRSLVRGKRSTISSRATFVTVSRALSWAFLKPMLLGRVLYYPDTPLTKDIIKRSNFTLQQFGDLRVDADEWLRSSSHLMQSVYLLNQTLPMLKSSLSNPFIQNFIKKQLDIDIEQMQETLNSFCVIFKLQTGSNTSSNLPPKVDYTIRMHIDNSMRTDRTRNPFWVRASYISPLMTQRYSRGFIYLQESIERAIISMQTGNLVQEPAVQIQAFPYPCFYKDEYLNSMAFAFPLVLMISWVLFVANFVKNLYMKMMGVNPFSHFLAWFMESAGFLLLTVIILTFILKFGGILPWSDGGVLFIYLCDYALSILAISFLVSSFFDKTNIAGLSGSLIYVICFFPFIVVMCLEESLPLSIKTLLWNNMYRSPVAGDTASFGWLCWLLLIDSFIYFLLGAYIRMVFPGRYGIAARWYFPFTLSFWKEMFGCSKKKQKISARGLLFTNMMQESQRDGKDKNKGPSHFHPHDDEEFPDLPVGVSLHGLTKTYGTRNAIKNLNLTFYEGHVTALLGHNGAGKTTTMSLLTGLFAPSSGTIKVYGNDMHTSTKDIRNELGVCMQYDVHFDHMTTKEHLLLYGQIKAPHWSKEELQLQVRKTLKGTGMYPHRHKRVGTLSGGMKRKLSISIAFIGGSRLVVLDEPTTGVDPCSRRSIWDIVLQHKSGRTIVLSTHHLDEAEVLSDRIAFLERGGLKCCGSPYYLKDKLARGYKLTLTKKVLPPDSDQRLDFDMVKSFVHSHMPEAQLKDGEVFLQLMRDSDDRKEAETHPYTVSNPELETGASRDDLSNDLNSSMYFGEKASQCSSAQQVMAILLKRLHHSRRNWKGLISQVLLPVLFVLAAMGLGSIKSDLQNFPEMKLTPSVYQTGKQFTFFRVCQRNPSVSDQWTTTGTPTPVFEGCKCGNFSQSCPKQGYVPPHKINPSSQIVYNLTGINVERYLLSTANDFIRDRQVWYNPEGHHTMPAYLNSLNNFILRSQIPANKQPQQYAISLSSHPYPGQVEEEDAIVRNLVNVLVAMCILTGFSIMTASFVIYEVHEHHTGSKRLQHISGISEPFYWIVNFFYDMVGDRRQVLHTDGTDSTRTHRQD